MADSKSECQELVADSLLMLILITGDNLIICVPVAICHIHTTLFCWSGSALYKLQTARVKIQTACRAPEPVSVRGPAPVTPGRPGGAGRLRRLAFRPVGAGRSRRPRTFAAPAVSLRSEAALVFVALARRLDCRLPVVSVFRRICAAG